LSYKQRRFFTCSRALQYDQPADEDRNFAYEPLYHSADVRALALKAAKASPFGVDLLLTAEWGAGFHKLSDEVVNKLPSNLTDNPAAVGSPGVSVLASRIPARYHFAATQNTFFELLPYRCLPRVCMYVFKIRETQQI
jgi:hypothetical protein